jgi:hypothetical protein
MPPGALFSVDVFLYYTNPISYPHTLIPKGPRRKLEPTYSVDPCTNIWPVSGDFDLPSRVVTLEDPFYLRGRRQELPCRVMGGNYR